MSDLIVLVFENEAKAREMRDKLLDLQKQKIVTLSDAAIAVRKENGKVKVKQLHSLVGQGALGGAFWGMLIGLLFWAPWLGLAIGAAAGALGGKFSDIGVDDSFIKEVGQKIEPGNAALFLLVEESTPDKLMPELEKFHPTILQTSLSEEDEAKLRETFGAHEDE
ncbi:MAG TPA: DUF1269 domain-containing protein [Anaerolineae bacterium]|nr:DUF1269 domain-containing protein [Anaerolineae bacterium]